MIANAEKLVEACLLHNGVDAGARPAKSTIETRVTERTVKLSMQQVNNVCQTATEKKRERKVNKVVIWAASCKNIERENEVEVEWKFNYLVLKRFISSNLIRTMFTDVSDALLNFISTQCEISKLSYRHFETLSVLSLSMFNQNVSLYLVTVLCAHICWWPDPGKCWMSVDNKLKTLMILNFLSHSLASLARPAMHNITFITMKFSSRLLFSHWIENYVKTTEQSTEFKF